jgi:hypothetical protein
VQLVGQEEMFVYFSGKVVIADFFGLFWMFNRLYPWIFATRYSAETSKGHHRKDIGKAQDIRLYVCAEHVQ